MNKLFEKLLKPFKKSKRKVNPYLTRLQQDKPKNITINLELPLMETNEGYTRSAMTFDSIESRDVVNRTLSNRDVATVPYAMYTALLENNRFLGFPLLNMLAAQVGLIDSACGILSDDMVRKWIEIVADNGDDSKIEKIKKIEEEMIRLDVRAKFGRCAYSTFACGGNMMYMSLNDDEEMNAYNAEQRSEELALDSLQIGIGALKDLVIIEPMRCTPILQNTSNPFKSDFYNPQHYLVMGNEVHRSRLLKFIDRELPEQLRPMYAYFGVSLTQKILSYIMTAENTRMEVAALVKRCNLNLIGANLEGILESTGDDAEDFDAVQQFNYRMEHLTKNRDNFGVAAYDKETEEITQIATSLTELDNILSKMYELTACVHHIPLTRWLGQSPAGMNATGQHDMKNYYDVISSYQEKIFRPNLEVLLRVIQLSLFGEIDENIKFKFVPLEQLNELEQAQVNEAKARVGVAHIQSGVISPREEAERISQDPLSGYGHIDISDIEDDLMENEEPIEQQPMKNPLKLGGG